MNGTSTCRAFRGEPSQMSIEWMDGVVDHSHDKDALGWENYDQPFSSSESDLCRNYQIMSTLMIVIMTCVVGPSIHPPDITFISPSSARRRRMAQDHKLSTPFPESINWRWSLSMHATFFDFGWSRLIECCVGQHSTGRITKFPAISVSLRSQRVTEKINRATKSRHLLVRNHCLLFLRSGLHCTGCVFLISIVILSPATMGNLGKSRVRKSNIANGFYLSVFPLQLTN